MASKKAQLILKAIWTLGPVSIHTAMSVALMANHQLLTFCIKIMNKKNMHTEKPPTQPINYETQLARVFLPCLHWAHGPFKTFHPSPQNSVCEACSRERGRFVKAYISDMVASPLAIHFVVLSKREKKIMFSWRKVLFFINPGYMLSSAH